MLGTLHTKAGAWMLGPAAANDKRRGRPYSFTIRWMAGDAFRIGASREIENVLVSG
jgi:hypothetical protein